ncbi:MAG: Glutamyl-tRNA reductase [Elusimicrobia bacterium]|nr:Glutamyl-tRNA reductase [Elusimicrobiota bacterium]
MGLISIGLSHKTAPVELRERLTIPPQQLGSALDQLFLIGELSEAVILSTCNRLEIYARPEKNRTNALDSVKKFFQGMYGSPRLEQALAQYEGLAAVEHLFRVASGLDSMVVGESEILGQVKSAYLFSQSHGTTGKITNVLFQRALFVGKQIRTKTAISEGASSVGSIAAQMAERIFGQLNQHRVLLLGAGEVAEVTARHLLSQKAGEVMILNRTREKAEILAKQFNGQAGSMDNLFDELLKADIVICSTASEKPLISPALVTSIMKARRDKSLYFVDIAVPRNVAAEVNEIDNVYLYNIDHLTSLVEENLGKRKVEMVQAESMVRELAVDFYSWIQATLEGKTKALKHVI